MSRAAVLLLVSSITGETAGDRFAVRKWSVMSRKTRQPARSVGLPAIGGSGQWD
jgi:hypothetical protein